MKKVCLWLILFTVVGFSPVGAMAAAKLTLSPSSDSKTVGSSFVVTVGIDSGTDKVIGIDVVGTFDATKLELVSVEKATSLGFKYDTTSFMPKKDNTAGTFEVTLAPESTSALTGAVAKGDLVLLTFKGKAAGSGAVTFNCKANSVKETNIINEVAADVIDCASNQSGMYTITSSGGSPDPTSTPAPTTTVSKGSNPTATPKPASLPKTGGVETTALVVLVGVISLFGAVLFR